MRRAVLVLLLKLLHKSSAQSEVNITVCKDSLCQMNCTNNVLTYNNCLTNTYGAFKFYNTSVQYYSDSSCQTLIQNQVIINGSCNILNNQSYYYNGNYVSQNQETNNIAGTIIAIIVVIAVVATSTRHCYIECKKEQRRMDENEDKEKKASKEEERPIIYD